MKKLILAGLILVSSQMAMAVNWIYIGQVNKGFLGINQNKEMIYGTYHSYIDKDSVLIKKIPNGSPYISVWVNARYPKPFLGVPGYEMEAYQFKFLIYFDSSNRSVATGYMSAYDKNGHLITPNSLYFIIRNNDMLKSDFIPNDWKIVVPDTINEKELNTVCSWVKIN